MQLDGIWCNAAQSAATRSSTSQIAGCIPGGTHRDTLRAVYSTHPCHVALAMLSRRGMAHRRVPIWMLRCTRHAGSPRRRRFATLCTPSGRPAQPRPVRVFVCRRRAATRRRTQSGRSKPRLSAATSTWRGPLHPMRIPLRLAPTYSLLPLSLLPLRARLNPRRSGLQRAPCCRFTWQHGTTHFYAFHRQKAETALQQRTH